MVDVDLGALAAAYWTANGHKWLCAPKGVALLHVRADLRPRIRPLVVSHGAQLAAHGPVALPARVRLDRHRRPVAGILALPAALRYVGGLDDDGWPGYMATNRSMARRGRDLLCAALGVPPPAPDSMIGSMASVPLPGLAPSRAAAERLQAALYEEERIEVPISIFPVPAALAGGAPEQALVRISAQRYNRTEEYARLAESLARRLRGPTSPRALLGRLRKG